MAATTTNRDIAIQHIEGEILHMRETGQGSLVRATQYAVIHGAIKAYLNVGVLTDADAHVLCRCAQDLLSPYLALRCPPASDTLPFAGDPL